MVLVLFFLFIIILLVLSIILTSILWLQIDITNFRLSKEEKQPQKINNDYEVFVYVYILKKIKIFKYKLNNKKVSTKYLKNIKNKLDYINIKKFVSNNFDYSNIKFIEIESLNLQLNIGIENVIATSGIVTIINILISIFLSKVITKFIYNNYNYQVKPIYENNNKIDLFLEAKIKIRLYSLIKTFKSYLNTRKSVLQKEKYLQTKNKYRENVNINTNII